MGTPTVISMSVRPQQASHLCFNVDGILGDPILLPNGAPLLSLGLYVAPVGSMARIGIEAPLGAAAVAPFDFDAFYQVLTSAPTAPGPDKSRLLYDATNLESHTQPYALATLRAEGRKVALRQAIDARQNAFYAKYINQNEIIAKMNTYYKPTLPCLLLPHWAAQLLSLIGWRCSERLQLISGLCSPARTLPISAKPPINRALASSSHPEMCKTSLVLPAAPAVDKQRPPTMISAIGSRTWKTMRDMRAPRSA
jgi:hypothetical protein